MDIPSCYERINMNILNHVLNTRRSDALTVTLITESFSITRTPTGLPLFLDEA